MRKLEGSCRGGGSEKSQREPWECNSEPFQLDPMGKLQELTGKSEGVANINVVFVAAAQGDTPSADVLVARDA